MGPAGGWPKARKISAAYVATCEARSVATLSFPTLPLVDDLDDRADLLDRVRDGSAVVREDQRIDRAAVDVGVSVDFGLLGCRGLEVHVRKESALEHDAFSELAAVGDAFLAPRIEGGDE